MTDRPQASQQTGSGASLVQDGHVMRSMVRNMVANMETVLNDLHGIMGEIQSLVVQIDTVTDKIDKQCGAEGGSGASSQVSQHCVKKPQCVHGSQSSVGAVYNPLYAQRDTVVLPNQCSNIARGLKNFEPTRPFRRDHRAPASKHAAPGRPLSSEIRLSWGNESRLPCSSKSFSYFPKDGSTIMSPSGSVAIVHPTIFCKPTIKPDSDPHKLYGNKVGSQDVITGSVKPAAYEVPCVDTCKIIDPCMKATTTQEVPTKSFPSQKASVRSKQVFPRQRHGITSVYNTHFQPVTPTEQLSPISQHASHVVKQVAIKHAKAKPSTTEQGTLSPSLYHKYATIGGSLPSSPRMKRSVTGLNQISSPNSPRLNRPSVKPYYHQIEGSVSSSMSPVSVRKPGAHHYYYSIESDLDSISEGPEARSMTPDIDWSYLNLIGNRNPLSVIAGKYPTAGSNNTYEIPIAPTQASQPFQMLQHSPDVVSRIPVFQAELSTAEPFRGRCSSSTFNELAFMNKVYNSPVVTHLYCSEVSAFESGEYCGCYEAVMDSVLENIAGFESFEDACTHLENDEVVIESYVSFDDEFEEDDWDLGMRAEDQDEFDLPSFIIHDTDESDQSLFGSFEIPNDSQLMFEASENTNSTHDRAIHLETKTKRQCVHLGAEKDMMYTLNEKDERTSPHSHKYDDIENGDVDFPGKGENSFTDDDCCALKPCVKGKHQNFSLWPKTFIPGDVTQCVMKSHCLADLDTQTSSSDASSCQAVGSGSPMSFSSPEAAFTSPDTDLFVTSSEGDDLLTSQEEAYFLSAENYDNAYVSNRRTNISQLRREFFESLYTVCDKYEREKELGQAEDVATQGFATVDNSKDTVSEAGSYQEDMTSYNKNVNTWTAYTMVHMQADDVSDTASDIINDNNISNSMTSSYLDADNIAAAPGSQALNY